MSQYRPKLLKARLPLSLAFALLLILLISFSTSFWATHPTVRVSLFASACFLVGIASLGRLWCSLYIAGYKMDRLVTEGAYSICRNPLYFFTFIGGIGCGLATETFTIPLLFAFFFLMYYPAVIKSEEIELHNLHNHELDNYLNTTPTFFPNLSLLNEPSTYLVNPAIFRRHIFDTLWFVWLIGIIKVVEGIHELQIIPVYFTLF